MSQVKDTKAEIDAGASRTGSTLIETMEWLWGQLQARHADLPDCVMITGAGREGRSAVRLGHWAHSTWRVASAGDEPVGEVFIAGELPRLGVVEILGTLLHEAAHALAHVRGIKDTSRGNRYHNARFRDLAEEVGLQCQRSGGYGWSDTCVSDETEAAYRVELEHLRVRVRAHRVDPTGLIDQLSDDAQRGSTSAADTGPNGAEGDGGEVVRGKRLTAECSCSPPRKVRVCCVA